MTQACELGPINLRGFSYCKAPVKNALFSEVGYGRFQRGVSNFMDGITIARIFHVLGVIFVDRWCCNGNHGAAAGDAAAKDPRRAHYVFRDN